MEDKRMAKKKESLIVASKVKAYIKSKNAMTSSDALETISDAVYAMLDAAVARTKANKRSTVKPQDI
jgi:histone H3/H4